MIKKLFKKLGYIKGEEVLKENFNLRSENLKLKLGEEESISRVVDVNLGDPSPVDTVERKTYVANVAGFHKNIQGKKILSMISQVRGEFEKVNRDTFSFKPNEYDTYLKGTINALWMLYDWGELMVSEQISYQTEEGLLTEEELQELKKDLN